jgi:hypothetical protein
MQHATRYIFNMQHATRYDMQHATRYIFNMQHATRHDMQHAARGTLRMLQHSTHRARHAASATLPPPHTTQDSLSQRSLSRRRAQVSRPTGDEARMASAAVGVHERRSKVPVGRALRQDLPVCTAPHPPQ